MFRVYTSIIRSIRCWVAAYGFLHRVFGWVVVLRAAGWVVCTVRMVPCDSHGTIRTVHTTYAEAVKTTTHPKTRCRKPYGATQHVMLLMMGLMYPKHVELKNTVIKLPSCIKLAFHFISWGSCTVKQPSTLQISESAKCNFSLLSFSLPSPVLQLRISDWFTEGKTKEETFLMQKLSDLVAPVVIFQTLSTVYQRRVQKWARVEWVCTGLYVCFLSSSCCCIMKQIWGLRLRNSFHKKYTHINFC